MKYLFKRVPVLIQKYEDFLLFGIASIASIAAITYVYLHGLTLAYGDAESHINIAKRVISGLTPGLAQLGGVWLPLPHMLMIPFVWPDALWRTGLGGAIVSGIFFVVTAYILYKITLLLTGSKYCGIIAFLVFVANPNILYMQATPMSELALLGFFTLSSYFYIRFLHNDKSIFFLIAAAFFAFCASLSRYDGWFLVAFETAGIIFYYVKRPFMYKILEGKTVLFATIGFFGILLWFLWDFLILGDPLYFTNSPFSAKSQQQGWLTRGELPGYKDIFTSTIYYVATAMENIGIILFILTLIGFVIFIFSRKEKYRLLVATVFLVPAIFYIVTLYLGQSVIFIPLLTPASYEWRLFNVRYGLMMVPFASVFIGYLVAKIPSVTKWVVVLLFIIQTSFFVTKLAPVVTLDDGTSGLSASKQPDAANWLKYHYDKGLVLLDDYARTVSITKSNLLIENVIYVGNKPYWDESLKEPEKYARWIVIQKDDAVWRAVYLNDQNRGRLFKYFVKAYTSPNILIFKRNSLSSSYSFSEKF